MNHEDRAERRRLMAEAVSDGASYGEVAEASGMCIQTVASSCIEFGVKGSLRNKASARRKQMADAVSHGEGVADVCQKYDVSYATVVNACKEHRVSIPKVNSRLLYISTYQILADLLYTDKSCRRIGKDRQLSHQRVHQIYTAARDAGIVIPSRGK